MMERGGDRPGRASRRLSFPLTILLVAHFLPTGLCYGDFPDILCKYNGVQNSDLPNGVQLRYIWGQPPANHTVRCKQGYAFSNALNEDHLTARNLTCSFYQFSHQGGIFSHSLRCTARIWTNPSLPQRNQATNLTCPFNSSQPYHWTLNGAVLNGQSKKHFSITSLGDANVGIYTCYTAANTSLIARLDLRFACTCCTHPTQWTCTNLKTIPFFPAKRVNVTLMNLQNSTLGVLYNHSFDGFVNSSKLSELSLINSGLTQIQAGAFQGLSHIRILKITLNPNLKTLPSGVFGSLKILTTLDLSGNQLTSMSSRLFDRTPMLKSVVLSSNPWHCDPDACSWLANVNVQSIAGECMTPSDMQSFRLDAAILSCEKYGCSPPAMLQGAVRDLNYIRDYFTDGNVTYSCRPGWEFNDTLHDSAGIVTCTKNAGKPVLSSLTSPCVKTIECNHSNIAHSNQPTSFTAQLGSEVSVQCNQGYAFNDSNPFDTVKTIVCTSSSVFNSTVPNCEASGTNPGAEKASSTFGNLMLPISVGAASVIAVVLLGLVVTCRRKQKISPSTEESSKSKKPRAKKEKKRRREKKGRKEGAERVGKKKGQIVSASQKTESGMILLALGAQSSLSESSNTPSKESRRNSIYSTDSTSLSGVELYGAVPEIDLPDEAEKQSAQAHLHPLSESQLTATDNLEDYESPAAYQPDSRGKVPLHLPQNQNTAYPLPAPVKGHFYVNADGTKRLPMPSADNMHRNTEPSSRSPSQASMQHTSRADSLYGTVDSRSSSPALQAPQSDSFYGNANASPLPRRPTFVQQVQASSRSTSPAFIQQIQSDSRAPSPAFTQQSHSLGGDSFYGNANASPLPRRPTYVQQVQPNSRTASPAFIQQIQPDSRAPSPALMQQSHAHSSTFDSFYGNANASPLPRRPTFVHQIQPSSRTASPVFIQEQQGTPGSIETGSRQRGAAFIQQLQSVYGSIDPGNRTSSPAYLSHSSRSGELYESSSPAPLADHPTSLANTPSVRSGCSPFRGRTNTAVSYLGMDGRDYAGHPYDRNGEPSSPVASTVIVSRNRPRTATAPTTQDLIYEVTQNDEVYIDPSQTQDQVGQEDDIYEAI